MKCTAADYATQFEAADITAEELTLDLLRDHLRAAGGDPVDATEELLDEIAEAMGFAAAPSCVVVSMTEAEKTWLTTILAACEAGHHLAKELYDRGGLDNIRAANRVAAVVADLEKEAAAANRWKP